VNSPLPESFQFLLPRAASSRHRGRITIQTHGSRGCERRNQGFPFESGYEPPERLGLLRMIAHLVDTGQTKEGMGVDGAAAPSVNGAVQTARLPVRLRHWEARERVARRTQSVATGRP
jgi:hypothetical protein